MAKRTGLKGTRRPAGGGDSPLTRLEAVLKDGTQGLTPAGRAIAAYLRDHLALVPFETGASIATRIGVSEMTVIRFLRGLGYASLKQLKDDLRTSYPDEDQTIDDVFDRFRVRPDGFGELRESLELEMRAVIKAYELAMSERWEPVVDLLVQRKLVYVVGFQATKGVAMDFANRLKYARAGVRFAEGTAGIYSEVLEADPQHACLVLVDTIAYARKGLLLARRAHELGIPLIIVTDRFSQWGYEFTDRVLQGHTLIKTFWDSTTSLSIILNLLINSVAVRLGEKAEQRFELLRELGRHFQEFEPLRR